MTVSFSQIPSNVRVPLVYIEFDNSRAVQGTPQVMHKVLVLGQMLAAGTAEAKVPVRITSADQAVALFGRGSMLAAMFTALKAADRYTETWAIPQVDDAAGVAAAGSVTVTGSATAAGTLNLYLAGRRVRLAVASGDTANEVATALAAAVNADPDCLVTAAVNGAIANQVDLTCRWKGETGNALDVRANYYQGETLPAGQTLAIVAMTGGSGNPDVADAIAAMGDEWWQTMVMPWTDAANLAALEQELADRWGPTRMIDGVAFCAFKGTHGESGAFGSARNSNLVTCLAIGAIPNPPFVCAAVNAIVAAGSLAIDPARPLQTLVLPGILPPAVTARWNLEERNLLLYDGLSTHTVDSGGLVRIERQVTMYQTNAYGVADPSYLDVNTPYTLSYLRYATRARITQKFPRFKLADDGTRFGAGQSIVTPSIIRAELLALFRELEEKGLVEGFEQYKTDLVVERDADDPNRVNVLSSPDLVNQFRIFAQQLQFIV